MKNFLVGKAGHLYISAGPIMSTNGYVVAPADEVIGASL